MIITVETVNDCGQTVLWHIDQDAVRRQQRREYRIGKALAFVAPVLIPILDSRFTLWAAVVIGTPFVIGREILRKFKKP